MDQSRQLQDYLEHYNDQSIDMIGILLHIKEKWKLAMIIIVIGGALSVAGALAIPKVYQAAIIASKGPVADIVSINQNGMTQYSDEQLFKLFYDRARARETFKQFIEQKGLLAQVFSSSTDVEQNKQMYYAKLYQMFNAALLAKGRNEEDTFLSKINAFKLTFESENEALGVTIMNQYLPYVQQAIIEELVAEEKAVVAARLDRLNREIEVSREQTKNKRLYEIARLEEANAKLLADLKQKKELLIEKTRQDRITQIANLEEANRLTLDKLNQERDLTLVKAKQIRMTEIAEAREALKIAKSLGIVDPTPLDELSSGRANSGETNINLTDVQEWPLYLMGTKFLETKIKTLSERNDDEQFIEEIHEIDMLINTAKNDQQIAQLKARESDKEFIAQLNAYNSQITAIENDPTLASLKARKSDDPYIQGLVDKLAEINRLEQLNFDFSQANFYVLDQAALISGIAIKPKRSLIVILGVMVSGIFAFIIVLLNYLIARRANKSKKA